MFKPKNNLSYKQHPNNIIMSENFYVSLNTSKHYHALNTLVIGTLGTGKSRYLLKPNLCQINTSFVVTDPKGELLDSHGEMLKKNGYNVKVFDVWHMKDCDSYNPLLYCDTEADIKKIVQAYIENTAGDNKNSSQDPFWDNAMNEFMCACIGLLTIKPKGEDVPYAQIPEVTGGKCYKPVLTNICDFTRMANKKWTAGCGIEKAEGAMVGDTKNNTANGSELAIIFENMKIYEAKRQNTTPDLIEKPYPLKEWENFKIAPEKTSTTVLMTAAVRLDPFNIEEVETLTSTDTIDLRNFGKEKNALFLIIPPTDKTYNFLVTFLFTQLIDQLYNLGANLSVGSKIYSDSDSGFIKYFSKEEVSTTMEEDVEAIKNATIKRIDGEIIKGKHHTLDEGYYSIIDAKGRQLTARPTKKEAEEELVKIKNGSLRNGSAPRLPLHVRFLLDEFPNTGKLENFFEVLSTCRGYEVSFTIICQTTIQLKGMYPDNWQTLDNNCPFTIFLGGDENETCDYLSKKAGKTTVKGFNQSLDSKNKASTSINIEERELIKPEEIGRMPFDKCLVFVYGEQPIKDDKFAYEKHPRYNQTHDFAMDEGLPHSYEFKRPKLKLNKAARVYVPYKAVAIPNVFDFTEDDFVKLMGVSNLDEAVEEAKKGIERQNFDINNSIPMVY